MDLGAELQAGGQAGKGQGQSARPDRELSTNWLRPTSSNLATSLASEAPSFRSSWQSQLNAWRAAPRGTNGVESEEASEVATTGTMSRTPVSLAANPGKITAPTQAVNSNSQSNSAVTKPNLSIPDVAGQKQTPSGTIRSAWKTAEFLGAQISVTGSADATSTEHQGRATRNRTSSATPPASQENTAQATTEGAQTIVPAIAAPPQLPAAPASSQTPTPAQTAETTPAPGPNFAPSHRRSSQTSGPAQLSESTRLSGPQSSSAEEVANDVSSNSTATGVPTLATHTNPALIPHIATRSTATPENAMNSSDDANDPATSRQMTSLNSSEARSTESHHDSLIAQTSTTNEALPGQSIPKSSTNNLNHSATAESVASFATPVAIAPGAAPASSDTVEGPSKQFTDRATTRAANRDAAGESSPSATQVSAAQPAVADTAASSGLRNAGAPQISTPTAPHDQPLATAASPAATTRDTISALDAGPAAATSPGTPAWTHAGGQHAEAGFRDPALGWVSVRADLDASGIHATVVPSSAEAAQALDGHLDGLSTHLAEQQSPVASLTVASPSGSEVENGTGQRMQQGAEGNPQGNVPNEAQAGAQQNAPRASSTSVLDASTQSGIRDSLTHPGDLRGTHISVMA